MDYSKVLDVFLSVVQDSRVVTIFILVILYLNFVIFVIKDVQIFANRLSEQNVAMIPLPEKSDYDEFSNTYTVTPQNLQR